MKSINKLVIPFLLIFSTIACDSNSGAKEDNQIIEEKENNSSEEGSEESSNEGEEEQGKSEQIKDYVDYELSTEEGLVVKFADKGARIESVKLDDVKIGQDGFIAGRVANRIANATFKLDGKTYNVDKNNYPHCLHGGSKGFGEINWTRTSQSKTSIVFELDSKDGDMGFPGNIHVSTTYTLSEDGTLDIEYRAKSDAKTIFNPTNHLYMNMNGISTNSYKNHSLWINAKTYTEAKNLIPTGNIVATTTKLDYFTKKTYVGDNDSNLVLEDNGYRKVAELTGNKTNYTVSVYSDRVGLQLYNNNSCICLEAQDFPDAINHSNFPSIVLEANTDYYSKTSYVFTK